MRRALLALALLPLAACGSSSPDASACSASVGKLSKVNAISEGLRAHTMTFDDAAAALVDVRADFAKGAGLAKTPGLQAALQSTATDLGKWRVNLLTGNPEQGITDLTRDVLAAKDACR